MPKRAAGLTTAKVDKAKPGRYGDGKGLYLLVKPSGWRGWVFRYVRTGKMREIGMGPAGKDGLSLSAARDKAATLWQLHRSGTDPLDHREAVAAAEKAKAQTEAAKRVTFKEAAGRYIEAHEAGWRNPKHCAQWRATLATYAFPHFGDVPVGDVATAHVLAALEAIWCSKPETASRLRGRIEAVLDYAKARGWRSGENPATWKGHLALALPARAKVAAVEHHAALPWREIGAFMAKLRTRPGIAARALEFAILTAARTGEVLGARWAEIDMDAAVWTVPAERMKATREHRVPLSEPALALLGDMAKLRTVAKSEAAVFPGIEPGKPLSGMAMLMTLRRMGRDDLTAHGFRSTFRDWAAEATAYPKEVAEMALAHTIGDKVEAAYRRGDLFDKRRRMMDDWRAFCSRPDGEAGSNVVALRQAGTASAA
jgi:integrase